MGYSGQSMKPAIPMNRLADRRLLLTGLDRIQASQDSTGTLDGIDKLRQKAFDVILGGVTEASDLSKEDPDTVTGSINIRSLHLSPTEAATTSALP